GMDAEGIALSLSRFAGTKRRFEKIGSFDGVDVIDDFAHHPTELAATLAAARGLPYDRVICVYQPHTYTRTEALYRDFAEALKAADTVLLAPIYAAREINEHNISSALIGDLVEGAESLGSFEEIEERVREISRPGDLVLTVGAGDVYKIGYNLIRK
ncbi:MAG: UDP-N-acetylmuramate--L-alanine ligase, partial [Clostridia bacterium]|nr:UDP-N-acetylmuramate--L-alanine ligase [Clostridia bacterium]